MIKTKEQLRQQSKKKLDRQVIEVNTDIQAMHEEIQYIVNRREDIKEVAPEVFNILMGIQRDLRFGRDRLKSIYNTLFRQGD